MKLYVSKHYQNEQNVYYPDPIEVTTTDELVQVARLDHVAAQYKNNHRKNENFIVSDCLMMDVDNAPAPGAPDIPPSEWVDLDKIAADLSDVEFYAVTSRNHMKEKKGRPARPKYHIYFPIQRMTDYKVYRAVKDRLKDYFPYFDKNAKDAARFFYGNSEAKAIYYPGSRTVTDFITAKILTEPVKSTGERSTPPTVTTTARSSTATTVDNGLYNLRDVLDAIDPARLDYSDWVSVGMVLHKYQGPPYYFTVDDWDTWSRRDVGRYKENDCYKRWNGFDDTGRIGAATLIKMAKDHGWTPPIRTRQNPPSPEPPAYMLKNEPLDWDGEIEEDGPETPRPSSVELSSVRDDTHVEGNEQPSNTSAKIPASKFVSAADYIDAGTYAEDMEYFAKYRDRKTGFSQIDEYLTLYPGLAALGGASSLGKTTFAVNLGDRLVQRGETILYFAMEQKQIELITKSVARIVKENNPKSTITNTDIKDGANTHEIIKARKQYREIAKNVYFFEGNFRMTAMDIKSIVESFMKEHDGVKPVVIVDYLQLIAPPLPPFHGGIREATDENLKTLKDMQKVNELFVIVISSFNRDSNLKPLAYESFKESSMIEYTCDYVWGLQLEILDADNTSFYRTYSSGSGNNIRTRETTVDERRSELNAAMRLMPKQVEFVSLKSRNGRQMYKACFDYYPMNDLYIEAPERNDQSKHYGFKEPEQHIQL